ncbi:MAG: SPW repeat protein [Candidatus Eremiobacteraeota bacterium]|nr:SPW repeat protein [Candidatus Eremiobacteraeota bacterium]
MSWKRWQDWSNLVLGAWLFFAPFIVSGYNPSSTLAAWIVGALIVAAALWALSMPQSQVAEWSNAILGSWTFLAPWLLGFSSSGAHAWNAWIVGALVACLSLSVLNSQSQAREQQKLTHG